MTMGVFEATVKQSFVNFVKPFIEEHVNNS
jgi:hypothetical protein